MELGPIFRALIYNRSRFWLITVEIALTLAIVANCVNILLDTRREMERPTGMDVENLLVVTTEPWGASFAEESFVDDLRERDLAALGGVAGVRRATAIRQIPLSGGGSATGRKPAGAPPEATSTAPYFVVSPGAVETLGVEIEAGRDLTAADWGEPDEDPTRIRAALVTRELADRLFPDGDAVGQRIESREGERSNVVVGVIRRMHNSWPHSDIGELAMLLPGHPGSRDRMRYLVRAEPGERDRLHGEIDGLFLGIERERIVTVESLEEVKADTYSRSTALIRILITVVALLVGVTGLGVVGLTSFSVAERRRQIGTRRALGATRGEILRYFLLENWMVTGCGLALGALLTYGLNFALTHVAGAPRMEGGLVLAGMLLLWALGQAATLLPAMRSMRVSPVVATRTV